MAREITISASTRPVCSSFFKIREQDSEYQSMEEFTYTHSEIDNSLLQKCFIKYRDKDELTYEQYVERFHEFVGTMRFVNLSRLHSSSSNQLNHQYILLKKLMNACKLQDFSPLKVISCLILMII